MDNAVLYDLITEYFKKSEYNDRTKSAHKYLKTIDNLVKEIITNVKDGETGISNAISELEDFIVEECSRCYHEGILDAIYTDNDTPIRITGNIKSIIMAMNVLERYEQDI